MNGNDLKNAVVNCPSLITPPFDSLFERIGYDHLYELAEEFGGGSVYIPTKRNMFKGCLIYAVVNEFDGANHVTLAKKYDFSVKGVRGFLKKNA